MNMCKHLLATTAMRVAACALIAVSLAGCGGGSVRPGLDVAVERERARHLIQTGQLRGAAKVYEQAARASDGLTADQLWIDAAHAWYRAGDTGRATRSLGRRQSPLPEAMDPLTALLAAQIDYDNGRYGDAARALGRIAQPYPESLAPGILGLRSSLLFRNGDFNGGVARLVEREVWLASENEIENNHRRIWDELMRAVATGYEWDPESSPDDTVRGWLALALATDWQQADPFAMKTALLAWESAFPAHPASADVLPALLGRYRALAQFPQRVAVLLPLTGRLSASAAAVRDGALAAHFDAQANGGGNSQVVFYDSATLGAEVAYRNAVADGADFVIGPLTKPNVSIVAAAPRRVPTLALNTMSEPGSASSLFQFALASEDEAAMAAQRAIADGHRRAVVLMPANSWGGRMAQHFSEQFEAAGGRSLTEVPYSPRGSDFSAEIRTALRLDQSDARHRELVRTVGEQMEFEPRRRGDVDVLFVAAQAEQARLIRPQLKFHYASDLPLYTTSSAFEPNADENADLNGIVFADMPFILEDGAEGTELKRVLREFWPTVADQRLRLYALGHDAYNLVPRLYANDADTEVLLEGLSGRLRLDYDGLIKRELNFVTVRRGQPERLPSLPNIGASGLPTGTGAIDATRR